MHASMGCSLIKIEKSENRNPVPQSIILNSGLEVSATGLTTISKSDFFPSSFRIEANNTIIYIDPLAVETGEKADLICITHAHPDHFSKADIQKLIKADTRIVCPKTVAGKLRKYGYNISVVKPGDLIEPAGNMIIEAVEAYNINSAFLWIKAHPRSKQNVGYIFRINGKSIYHAGDSDFVPEMKNIKNIDLALVPVGGDNLTMGIDEAVKLIHHLRPGTAVPMHYETKINRDMNRAFKGFKSDVKIVKLD